MQKVAFFIPKGGVGKTSLGGNVAYFASLNLKVCLVDSDPQGNTTNWFLGEDIDRELADYFQNDVELGEIIKPITENLWLIPTASIGGELKRWSETRLMTSPYIFEDLSTDLEKAGFDLIIYDLSPGLSMLERCILLACDEVVTPMTPEFFSLDGLESFIEALKEINQSFKVNVQHSKLVVNNLNKSFRKHRESEGVFRKLDLEIFIVPQDRNIAESQFAHMALMQYDPGSRAVPGLRELTRAIVGD